jgi:hypothetical protein
VTEKEFLKITAWAELCRVVADQWIADERRRRRHAMEPFDEEFEKLCFATQRVANQLYYVPDIMRGTPAHTARLLRRTHELARILVHA